MTAFTTHIKNTLFVSAAAIFLMCASSCLRDELECDGPALPSGPVLRLVTSSVTSRADQHYGDDPYAEDSATLREEKLGRVNLFFFESAESKKPAFFTYEIADAGKTEYADITVKVPVELASAFSDDNEAYVYALVNLPESIAFPSGESSKYTIDYLKNTGVSEPAFLTAQMPGSFVMSGSATVKLEGNGKDALISGWIPLKRLASKIRLFAGIEETIYIDENGKTLYRFENENEEEWLARRERDTKEIWHSEPMNETDNTTNVHLYIYNVATKGQVSTVIPEDPGYGNVDRTRDRENAVRKLYERVSLNDYDEKYSPDAFVDRSLYPWTHAAAYYSYPNEWDSENFAEEHRTYVILSVPWRREDTGDGTGEMFQTCYYQIPVNALKGTGTGKDKDRLEPNTYYRIKIDIGMLGSKELGTPLPVDASYEVLEWKNNDVDVNIKGRRYLVVNQTYWTMNNISRLDIPFSSSHDVVAECYVTYFRYNDIWGTAANTQNTHDETEFTEWLKAAKGEGDYPGLPGKEAGEGLITAAFTTTRTESKYIPYRVYPYRKGVDTTAIRKFYRTAEKLYYKSEYFNDPYINYTYYVGHEHPITFQPDFVEYDENVVSDEHKVIWNDYIGKYGISAIYTCEPDNVNHLIKFNHPLIQWKDVRKITKEVRTGHVDNSSQRYDRWTNTYETTSELQYYVPELHPRRENSFWDEFSRCDIVIKLRHADWKEGDDLFEETIYVTQYPGMYITVSHNYGSPGNSGNQYVKVNNYNSETNNWWKMVTRIADFSENSSNANPNMYLIHTTQLSEDNENLYEIGDPRTLYFNNSLETAQNNEKGTGTHGYDYPLKDIAANETTTKSIERWSGTNHASTLFAGYGENNTAGSYLGDDGFLYSRNAGGNTRSSSIYNPNANGGRLAYYYPTDESVAGEPGSKENFVAPVFRIASSFGRVTVNGRTEMRRRCAAYQEAGRPAGRWRLPTKAEVKYIAQLSADGKIPVLFGSTQNKEDFGYYWTAQGGLRVNGAGDVENEEVGNYGTNLGLMAARCVYDEWYWNKVDGGQEFPNGLNAQTTDFYWGDVKKDNTQAMSLMRSLINGNKVSVNE